MHSIMDEIDLTSLNDKLTQELRRGVLVLAALSQLRQPRYGYSLIDELSHLGLQIDQGTLYPLLRRLEEQGLLESSWNVEGTRPRRYYALNPAGAQLLARLSQEWQQLAGVMQSILQLGESYEQHE